MRIFLLLSLLFMNLFLYGQCSNFTNSITAPYDGSFNGCNDDPPTGPASICARFVVHFVNGNASYYYGYTLTDNGVSNTTTYGPINTHNNPYDIEYIVCVQVPCGETISFFIDAYSNPNGGGNLCNEANATITTEPISVMPIVLKEYQVTKDGTYSKLHWVTASEINNDYFTIERSLDGRTFNEIAEINGAGNSNVELNYSFVDENPNHGLNYYRIKQTDFDGKFSYSNIQVVKHDLFSKIEVYPNPANSEIYVSTPTSSTLEIVNSLGSVLERVQIMEGTNTIKLDGISDGILFLSVGNQNFKILKNNN